MRSTAVPRALATALLSCMACAAAQAEDVPSLSFDQAYQRLLDVSDGLDAARARQAGKAQLETASRRLRLPEISGEVQRIDLQKTVELPLGSLAPVAEAYGIDSPLRFVDEQWHTRPSLKATLPLYTGGAIPARQATARAARRQADAELEQEQQALLPELARVYFGQRLAELTVVVRKQAWSGLQGHLEDTRALEREGFATAAQRLQAEVAQDQAQREYRRAVNDLESVRATLSLTLRAGTLVGTRTELFIVRRPLADLGEFREAALQRHPQLARLRAVLDQAEQGARLQRATLKPQMYAFGQYGFRRSDALLTEPDWVFGIALKYTFFSGTDRPRQLAAANAQVNEAEAGLNEARNRIEIAVVRAYGDLDTARQQYLLLESSLARARENVRLQTLSFREGQATSQDVVDARVALSAALIERAKSAYDYDVALAQLLQASGQPEMYAALLAASGKVEAP